MMLDLYASQVEGQQIGVTSACLAAGVPSTTALGWLVKLQQRGLVWRKADPRDGRRAFLGLAPAIATKIEDWLITSFE